jgi:cell division protein FtsQ
MARSKTVRTSSVGRTIYHRSETVVNQNTNKHNKKHSNRSPKQTVRLVAVVALLGLLVVGIQNASSALAESDFFKMSHIKVVGNHLLPEQEVITWSNLQVGDNLFDCDLAEVTKRVESQPIVKRVLLLREPPETVVMSLEERKPVALIATSNGLMGLDAESQLFPIPNTPIDLPIISNLTLVQDSTGTLHNEMLPIWTAFLVSLKTETPNFWNEISEVHITDKKTATVYLVGDQLTLHMHQKNPKQQVQNFRAYTQASSQKIAELAYIDLRFKNQVVVGKTMAQR